MPRIILPIFFQKVVAVLSGLVLILFIAGCGGGGGGNGGGGDTVTVAGKVDDGTPNSPISGAFCDFVDLNGKSIARTTAGTNASGNFVLRVPQDKEGYIQCSRSDIPKLKLSNFSSTKDRGKKIQNENVTPAATVVADIIKSEKPANRLERRDQLLKAIENDTDAELSLLVEAATILFKNMLRGRIDVPLGGGGEGGQNNGPDGGGGVEGDNGDGALTSPIPNAICDFVAMRLDDETDLREGEVLYDAALADFCKDGMVNRPDLEAIAGRVNEAFEGRQKEIMAALESYFSECIGRPYRDTADGEDSETPGRYFLPIPPNVQGFVRCTPPNQPELRLATFVSTEGLAEDDTLSGQDVNPASTFFSQSIATKLEGDLSTVEENFLDDIAGLGDIQIKRDGEMIERFELQPGADPTDEDVGLVAFSAASLFNILFKNEMNVDFLATLDDLIEEKEVDPNFLKFLGISPENAENWSNVVNTSDDEAGEKLGTNMDDALSTARIRVTVTDQPVDEGGKGIPDVRIDITDPPSGVECVDCPGVSDNNGEVTLTLTGVDTEAIQIEVEATPPGTTSFKRTKKTTQVVAFATVDLEIAFTYKLTVEGGGTGNGAVTSVPSGISCDIIEGVGSGDCSENYDADTEVTLTADPLDDYAFDGWSGGGCSGTSDCTVTMNQMHTVSAKFTLQPTGSLRVTISPPAAVSAGAQWRVVGGTWRNSGDTESDLSVGTHTVEYKKLEEWDEPDDEDVTIIADQTTTTSGTYVIIPPPQTGSLTVTLEPPAAVSAGAQWRVDGGTWRNSGDTESDLSVGTHTVDYQPVTDWIEPKPEEVTIIADQTTTTSGTYEPIQKTLIWDSGNWDEKNWQ